ncbi:MAG: hypothetical protein MHM6MM_003255 [Cercozoa sp. M6MM]
MRRKQKLQQARQAARMGLLDRAVSLIEELPDSESREVGVAQALCETCRVKAYETAAALLSKFQDDFDVGSAVMRLLASDDGFSDPLSQCIGQSELARRLVAAGVRPSGGEFYRRVVESGSVRGNVEVLRLVALYDPQFAAHVLTDDGDCTSALLLPLTDTVDANDRTVAVYAMLLELLSARIGRAAVGRQLDRQRALSVLLSGSAESTNIEEFVALLLEYEATPTLEAALFALQSSNRAWATGVLRQLLACGCCLSSLVVFEQSQVSRDCQVSQASDSKEEDSDSDFNFDSDSDSEYDPAEEGSPNPLQPETAAFLSRVLQSVLQERSCTHHVLSTLGSAGLPKITLPLDIVRECVDFTCLPCASVLRFRRPQVIAQRPAVD